MAGAKRLWCKRLLEIFLSGASAWDDVFWVMKRVRSKPVKSRVANFSRKEGTLLLGFSGCGKKQVMYGM